MTLLGFSLVSNIIGEAVGTMCHNFVREAKEMALVQPSTSMWLV